MKFDMVWRKLYNVLTNKEVLIRSVTSAWMNNEQTENKLRNLYFPKILNQRIHLGLTKGGGGGVDGYSVCSYKTSFYN